MSSVQDSIESNCEILGFAGVLIQVVLGFLSFSVLIYKRRIEHPKRPWKIWMLDTSKQGCSQLLAHFINVAISLGLTSKVSGDPCLWYLTTNVLDNTLGVFASCALLLLLERTLLTGSMTRFRSGNYYSIIKNRPMTSHTNSNASPLLIADTVQLASENRDDALQAFELQIPAEHYEVRLTDWVVQFVLWNCIVVICKTALFELQLALSSPLLSIAEGALWWIQPFPVLELLVVVVAVPLIMNGFAFWVQDNIIKGTQLFSKNAESRSLINAASNQSQENKNETLQT